MHGFFVNIDALLESGDFVGGYSTIAFEAPELWKYFIYKYFVHVGESATQNNILLALAMNQILYHANAWAHDHNSICILFKQQAFMVRDERTRNNTAIGERPTLAKYLVMMMMQVSVLETSVRFRGHTLGVDGHVMCSY